MTKVSIGIVPGFFTMANMFCGFYSVIQSAQNKFVTAAWLIVAAAVLDVLDGKLARLTDSSSNFGVQYDSMADVVSFGFAPSALAYFVFFSNWGTIGILLSFMPLVFGSIRLARFNVRLKGYDKPYFEGAPIPASAVVLSTFVIFNFEYWGYLRWSKIFLSVMLLVSLLMVSSFRYETMPNFSLQSGVLNRIKALIVVICVGIIIVFPQEALFPLAVLYLLSGPARMIWQFVNPKYGKKSTEIKDTEDENRRQSAS
ncbi:MAG: CDP-diacylglycerol--serine O-phosphatidyltransferase [Calditrichae bacterium]|nr:CDP-diacylglycerol--serine O-phosphatidyltransferase [Calditrichia bacterium]